MDEWLRWGIGLLIAVVIFVVGWRWPRAPKRTRQPPPELTLERVGGLAHNKGPPSEHVRMKLQLTNRGGGTARSWQVAISNPATPGLKLAKSPLRGQNQFATTVRWHQDTAVGEIPSGQARELPEWLWVEGPVSTLKVRLPVTIHAEGVDTRTGTLVVTFPSGPGGPDVEFEP